MYYELYIDVFFLENFMLDSLLLLIVNRIINNGRSYGRLLLGGAAGSLLTCLVIVLPFPSVLRLILFHTLVDSAMLFAGLRITGLPQFIRALLFLYVSAFFMGGILQVMRPYMRYASLFYAAAVLSGAVLLQLWKIVSHICRQQGKILKVTLYTEYGQKSIKALLDTGNELRDCYTGDPVSVIDPETAAEIWSCGEPEKGFRLIPYRCVGGESIMKVFRLKKICIHMEEDRWIDNPLVGIGEAYLSGNREYEMILNPAIFSG